MTRQFDTGVAIYTPQEAARYGLDAIHRMVGMKMRGLNLNIAEIRDYLAPVMPGQLCVVLAQTSNYKSGFLHFWEREAAKQLIEENRLNESIIHISVEECVEEQIFLEFARESGEDAGHLARGIVQDWSKLEAAAIYIETVPIYRIGDSLSRSEEFQSLYLSNIIRSLKDLVEGKITGSVIKPAAIFVDYLQALPFDPEVKNAGGAYQEQRRLQVRQDTYRLRQAANFFDAPVIVAVQAKQHLEGAPSKDIQIPGIYDGEESSSIAQRSDRIIQLWMPKMTHTTGMNLEYNNLKFEVRHNTLFIKIGKQRGGFPSGKTWQCFIDFDKNNIAPETKYLSNGSYNYEVP
jgi:replicative DNA helicase